MRWLGILGIYCYRIFVRPFLRRHCLYDESCSTYGLRMLREHGLLAAVAPIRRRTRSCRMPAMASFVIDENGRAHVLSAVGHDGEAPPPLAIEILARQAEGYGTESQE